MLIVELLQTYLEKIIDLGINPASRLYWPFVLTTLVFSLLYLKVFRTNQKFSLKIFKHSSSIQDYKLMLLNSGLKLFIFPLFLASSFSISVLCLKGFRFLLPSFYGFEISGISKSILATLLAFALDDFLRFAHHYFMHKSLWLRGIHHTHHSAKVLTPFTLFRTHPLESFMAGLRNSLSIGSTLALYTFLFNGQVQALDIIGVNLFGFLFNALGANLRHSPIPLSFGYFEYIFISPRMHQIHHSNNPLHFNKNYGVALSLWDQLIGSFYRPLSCEADSLEFGIIKKSKNRNFLQRTFAPS